MNNYYNYIENGTYVRTDDGQWVLSIDPSNWKVIQIILWGNENEYGVDIQYIDFNDYTEEEIKRVIEEFGYSETPEMVYPQFLAEMLAESTTDKQIQFKGTWKECYEWIMNYIK